MRRNAHGAHLLRFQKVLPHGVLQSWHVLKCFKQSLDLRQHGCMVDIATAAEVVLLLLAVQLALLLAQVLLAVLRAFRVASLPSTSLHSPLAPSCTSHPA